MTELILGLATGIIFGVLLQQGRVLRFEKQVGAMLLKDMTILKFMLSAIVVGMVGLHLLAGMEVIQFKVKGTMILANLLGGLIFGAGWAVVGYCPGTAFGALGEGRLHALLAVVGMVGGAALYAELHSTFKKSLLTVGEMGKATLPDLLGLSPWLVIAAFAALVLCLFAFFEMRRL